MPIIKSAKKKVTQDKKRTVRNTVVKRTYKQAVKAAREKPIKQNVRSAYSALDKAVKKNVIAKNKASRIKSQVAKHAKHKSTAK